MCLICLRPDAAEHFENRDMQQICKKKAAGYLVCILFIYNEIQNINTI